MWLAATAAEEAEAQDDDIVPLPALDGIVQAQIARPQPGRELYVCAQEDPDNTAIGSIHSHSMRGSI